MILAFFISLNATLYSYKQYKKFMIYKLPIISPNQPKHQIMFHKKGQPQDFTKSLCFNIGTQHARLPFEPSSIKRDQNVSKGQ